MLLNSRVLVHPEVDASTAGTEQWRAGRLSFADPVSAPGSVKNTGVIGSDFDPAGAPAASGWGHAAHNHRINGRDLVQTARAVFPSKANVLPCWTASSAIRQGRVELNPIATSVAGLFRDLTQSRKFRAFALVSGSSS
jgi:hypothetical protein